MPAFLMREMNGFAREIIFVYPTIAELVRAWKTDAVLGGVIDGRRVFLKSKAIAAIEECVE